MATKTGRGADLADHGGMRGLDPLWWNQDESAAHETGGRSDAEPHVNPKFLSAVSVALPPCRLVGSGTDGDDDDASYNVA